MTTFVPACQGPIPRAAPELPEAEEVGDAAPAAEAEVPADVLIPAEADGSKAETCWNGSVCGKREEER